ncbi:twin-arginine translocation signal domain-containing protein, partial [Nocardia carnea]|uniref:twin-arginine translocation signal domain-containing protein n=1 Tax=Nocardia carnea TaxID=37328 RepID=UPI003D782AE3
MVSLSRRALLGYTAAGVAASAVGSAFARPPAPPPPPPLNPPATVICARPPVQWGYTAFGPLRRPAPPPRGRVRVLPH